MLIKSFRTKEVWLQQNSSCQEKSETREVRAYFLKLANLLLCLFCCS